LLSFAVGTTPRISQYNFIEIEFRSPVNFLFGTRIHCLDLSIFAWWICLALKHVLSDPVDFASHILSNSREIM